MRAIINLTKASLLAATMAVLFTACKKDKDATDNPGNNPPASAKLKKVSMDNEELEFAYSADGKVQSIKTTDDLLTNGMPTTFTVNYSADKKISELKAADGFRIVPHYAAGELSTADIFDENGDLILTTRYEFLNGVLKSATASLNNMDALKFSFEYNAAGNIQKTSTWTFNPLNGQLAVSGYTNFEYDSKTNPMHAHKDLFYLLLQNVSKNNTTKETAYTSQNQVDETKEYTYQYNNQSLPQSATVKTTAAGQTSNSTLLFSYQ